jgi:hypothetical protein
MKSIISNYGRYSKKILLYGCGVFKKITSQCDIFIESQELNLLQLVMNDKGNKNIF